MVAEHIFAVGNGPYTKEMVGVVSKPKVGGTSAPVANAKTSPRVALASLPEKDKKIYKLIQY